MGLLAFLCLFVPLSALIAIKVAAPDDRSFLVTTALAAWLFLGSLLAAVHGLIPFSLTGDDSAYFRLAATPIQSLKDALDLTRFIGEMEQPGYPWLLSLVNRAFGHELLVFKFVNLFFLILLALTWYRIGLLLESAFFARQITVAILLLSPLWFYMFFLLKDMPIALLQSLILLSAIQLWQRVTVAPAVALAASAFFLLLLRSPLILQIDAVLLGSFLLKSVVQKSKPNRFAPLIITILLVAASVPIITDPDSMMRLGIQAKHRVIASTEMFQGADLYRGGTAVPGLIFPVVYLFSETAGLNPETWLEFNARWMRGVLALPWIFCIVPFFLLGLGWLFRPACGFDGPRGLLSRLRHSYVIGSPWSIILAFLLSSFAISWFVGDSTRWRISDMPTVAAIAVAGWMNMASSQRKVAFLGWAACISLFFPVYYFVRG